MKPLIPLIGLVCVGCAQDVVVPSKLSPPSARLMVAPQPLPTVKPGDDLYAATAVCRAEYGREASKLVGLQGYTRTILKKK